MHVIYKSCSESVSACDSIAQLGIERCERFDWRRTARFAGIAFFIVTPITRTWIDIILPKLVPSNAATTQVALKKVGLDMP